MTPTVQGFPTIKYGDPSALEDYQGGRDYDSLKKFADGLKPTCSPANIDLCDEEQTAEIKKLQDFDLIWQTLGGLSNFFDNLREQVTTEDMTDIDRATSTVTLRKLRDRLRERSEMFEL